MNTAVTATDGQSETQFDWGGLIAKVAYGFVGLAIGLTVALFAFERTSAIPYAMTLMVGLGTASVELLKKYSSGTSVLTLLKCWWTWLYFYVNGAVALLAYVLLQDEGVLEKIGAGSHGNMEHSAILVPLLAGIGAMMVLRSSVISVRAHGRDYPVGLALILDALQDQIEHRIDQARAAQSFEEVSKLMRGVTPSPDGIEIASLALHALERLNPEAQTALRLEISKLLKDSKLTNAGKAIAIGISVRKVAGLEVLRKVVSVVRKDGSAAQGSNHKPASDDDDFRSQRDALFDIPD